MKLNIGTTPLVNIKDAKISRRYEKRLQSGKASLDEFFNGGILRGTTFTLTAAPGVGKSTLLQQLADCFGSQGFQAAFVSGEQSTDEIVAACNRLNILNINIGNETDIDRIAEHLAFYDILIVDSYQSLTSAKVEGPHKLEEYAINTLVSAAKMTGCILGFICHVTKAGEIKGSTLITHSVDINIELEVCKTKGFSRRLSLRKSRIGPCNEMLLTFDAQGFNFNSGYQGVDMNPPQVDLREEILKMPLIHPDLIAHQFEIKVSQARSLLRSLMATGQVILDPRNGRDYIKAKSVAEVF
jgi:predicted ATP-dependent serine protease